MRREMGPTRKAGGPGTTRIFIEDANDKRIVCLIRRAASASMAVGLGAQGRHRTAGVRYVKADAVLARRAEGWDVLAWFRNPKERIASMFTIFAHHYHTPERLAQVIIDGHKDPHWDLQLDLLTYDSVFLPTIVYKFDDLRETWRQEMAKGKSKGRGKQLGAMHRSGPRRVTWDTVLEELAPPTKAKLQQYLQPDLDYDEGLI